MQKGFATLEVILMVMVIGILASIAVPRFTDITTSANTAKIQADLSTIDTAIAIYSMENNDTPDMEKLKPYLQDADKIKPPTGKAFVNGTATAIVATTYAITADTVNTGGYRATLDDKTAGQFTKKTSST